MSFFTLSTLSILILFTILYYTLYYTQLVALSHGSQGGEPPLRPLVGQKNT